MQVNLTCMLFACVASQHGQKYKAKCESNSSNSSGQYNNDERHIYIESEGTDERANEEGKGEKERGTMGKYCSIYDISYNIYISAKNRSHKAHKIGTNFRSFPLVIYTYISMAKKFYIQGNKTIKMKGHQKGRKLWRKIERLCFRSLSLSPFMWEEYKFCFINV